MSVSPVLVRLPVTALRVANEAFLVSSTIDRCPKTMMIRELVVNAIEAAREAQGEKRVDILAVAIEGVPKLCIRNTGRGLSADELDRICDLASSLNKVNSLDANFGMGAKVASMPSNKHGMRYRSCRDGVVNEVILCQREGVYGRLQRGEEDNVIEVTQACVSEHLVPLDHDWTEVVLFGNSAGQNTVLDPYAGNPRSESNWLTKNLLLRFFRIPEGVKVVLSPEILGTNAPVTMGTLAAWAATRSQRESVRTPSGVTLHYCYNPHAGSMSADPFSPDGGIGCIVYKDEVYDPRTDKSWAVDAPSYGVSFGARHVSVFVELPDDYLVRPEAYRQFLRFRGGDQRQVFLGDFGQLVNAYIPLWLKKVIRSYGPEQAEFLNDVTEELRSLVAELDIAPDFVLPRPAEQAKPQAAAPKPPAPALGRAQDATINPPPPAKPPVPSKKTFERPPEIIGLDSEEMIAERGIKGRAAKFYPSSHQLFINLHYPSVATVAARLEAEFFETADTERLRIAARSVAGWTLTRQVARALIYSLTKKAAGWPAEDVKRAQSPESFSLIADDTLSVMEVARLRMDALLGEVSRKSAA